MSKVIRINEDLIEQLNKINPDINKAVTELLQICNKSVTNDLLSNPEIKKEIENTLIKIKQHDNALRQHTQDITEIQEKIQQLAVINKWRMY